jgi:glycosyltransferase involved in cell wall biosynthesis
MRVLLVSSSSGSRGGGEIFLLTLAEQLAKLGHAPSLWASNHFRMNELCNRFEGWGPVHRFPYQNTYDRRSRVIGALLDRPAAQRVARHWQSLRPDIIHLNKQNLEDGLDLVAAAHKAGLPGVMTLHVTQSARQLGARFGILRDFVTRSFLQSYPGILVAIGRSRLADLQGFLNGSERARLVENGVPIPSREEQDTWRMEIRRKLGFNTSDLLGIAVGRMVEQKRPALFLSLAEQVCRRIPRSRFVWVGGGPLEEWWQTELKRRCLDQQIAMTGWVANPQPYYAAADFLLHTAHFEGLPLALLEGASWGLPIAVTQNLYADLDFLPELGALVADPEKPDWGDCLADPAEREKLGSRARALVISRFSSERMAKNYIDLYQEAQ